MCEPGQAAVQILEDVGRLESQNTAQLKKAQGLQRRLAVLRGCHLARTVDVVERAWAVSTELPQ